MFGTANAAGKEFIVWFPEPFLILSFSILVFPQAETSLRQLTLRMGNSYGGLVPFFHRLPIPNVTKPQWLHFDLVRIKAESAHFPTDPLSHATWPFVSLLLSWDYPGFGIGNVRFKVVKPQSGHSYELVRSTQRGRVLAALATTLASLALPLRFYQMQGFEAMRIENGISDADWHECVARLRRNPFSFDTASQLARKVSPNHCQICNSAVQNQQLFVPRREYPKFLMKSPDGRGFALCDACARDVMEFDSLGCVQSAISDKRIAPVGQTFEPVPFYQHFVGVSGPIGHLGRFLFLPTGVSPRQANSILNGTGAVLVNDEAGEVTFGIVFPGLAVVNSFQLVAESQADIEIEIRVSAGVVLGKCRPNESFVMSTQPTEILFIVLRGSNGVHCTMQHIEIAGVFCERPPLPPIFESREVVPEVAFSAEKSDWDAETRTQAFKFSEERSIRGLWIKLSPGVSPISISVVFASGESVLGWYPLLLPEVFQETVVSYSTPTYNCTEAKVFYIDRVAAVLAHKIMFY
jgi:hypothetical protein